MCSLVGVTSPIILTANPGPGNGCLINNFSGTPKIFAIFLTSSLYNSLNGSRIFKSSQSGKPPTLWCDFITAAGPFDTPLSITSGYNVPWASHLKGPFFSANSVNTWINSSPTIILFFSGSSIPFNLSKNTLDASIEVKFTLKLFWNISSISTSSFNLKRPLFTKTHFNLSPMALWINNAATVESIPPLTPHKTFPSILDNFSTSESINPSIVQSWNCIP